MKNRMCKSVVAVLVVFMTSAVNSQSIGIRDDGPERDRAHSIKICDIEASSWLPDQGKIQYRPSNTQDDRLETA